MVSNFRAIILIGCLLIFGGAKTAVANANFHFANLSELTVHDGKLYFTAEDAIHGQELWQYDPQSNVATLIEDFLEGASGSDPENLVSYGGRLYFSNQSQLSPVSTRLRYIDQLTNTIQMVEGVEVKKDRDSLFHIYNPLIINNELVFVALFGFPGIHIAAFNQIVIDSGLVTNSLLNETYGTSRYQDTQLKDFDFVPHKQYLIKVFSERGSNTDRSECARFFDTVTSSITYSSFCARGLGYLGLGGNYDQHYIQQVLSNEENTYIFFNSNIYYHGDGLSVHKGGIAIYNPDTDDETLLDGDWLAELESFSDSFVKQGSKVYFVAKSAEIGNEIFEFDLEENQINLYASTVEGSGSLEPDNLFIFAGELYFSGFTESQGRELWKVNKSTSMVELVADINQGDESSNPVNFQSFDHKLFFHSNSSESVGSLTYYDPVANSITNVSQFNIAPAIVLPEEQLMVNEGDTFLLELSTNDEDNDELEYFWRQVSDELVLDFLNKEKDLSFLAPEVHHDTSVTFSVEVSDGNYVKTVFLEVNIVDVNKAPTMQLTPSSADVLEGEELAINLEVQDLDDDELTIMWEQLSGSTPIELANAVTSFAFVAPSVSEDEDYRFKVTVSDGDLSVSEAITIKVLDKPKNSSGGALWWLLLLSIILMVKRSQ